MVGPQIVSGQTMVSSLLFNVGLECLILLTMMYIRQWINCNLSVAALVILHHATDLSLFLPRSLPSLSFLSLSLALPLSFPSRLPSLPSSSPLSPSSPSPSSLLTPSSPPFLPPHPFFLSTPSFSPPLLPVNQGMSFTLKTFIKMTLVTLEVENVAHTVLNVHVELCCPTYGVVPM